MSNPLAILDGILTAIEIFDALSSRLAIAAARVQQGGELTPEDRAAIDAANGLARDRLLGAIAQRVGPDPADAPAIGDSLQNEKTARAQAGEQ